MCAGIVQGGDVEAVGGGEGVTLYRRPCRVVARGKMNSVLIEFDDGRREVVSRNAVRRLRRENDVP